MRRLILITVLTLLAGLIPAFAAAADEEIRAAEKGWVAAVKARDFKALDQILGSRLIYNHSTGVVENKDQYLARLKTGAQRYDGIEHQSMEVRSYGTSAVVSSKARMTGKSNDRAFDDTLLMIHFWVKQGARWQLVAHQTTKLP